MHPTLILSVRSIEVCLELNLMEGVKFHERLVNKIIPVEMDLASSYISMAVFKEKQYQVCVLYTKEMRAFMIDYKI